VQQTVRTAGGYGVELHFPVGIDHCGTAVKQVSSTGDIILTDGSIQSFDQVIFAAHGDQALGLLESPTTLETAVLSAFSYQPNLAVLHRDERVMPQTRRCWASWNYRTDHGKHSTHYWMNRLQGVSDRANYFVSINPSSPPDETGVVKKLDYEHPLFDLKAIAAQGRIGELNQAGETTGRYFCGAWQRYGFHEDGLWSAERLCANLLGRSPWT
jgi:predicted NAD/FAD-binding protein